MKVVEALFSVREVARLFGLNESRIRYWAQTGFINPSGTQGGKRLYAFGDLVAIRAAVELLERGIPLQRVRRNLQALREKLPELEQPLSKLRVCSDGEHLVVGGQPGAFEPLSGQLILDFELEELHTRVTELLLGPGQAAPPARPAEAGAVRSVASRGAAEEQGEPATAYGWFLRGCAQDQTDEAQELAMTAYRRAVGLDPSLAAAHTNLGNLHYRRGEHDEALRCYERASVLDPDQAQAHYNVANLYEEAGDLERAIAEYRRAVSADPTFLDAHFNLALTLERVGSRVQAREHWQRFIAAVSPSRTEEQPWLTVAQAHLEHLEHLMVEPEQPSPCAQEITSSGS